MDAVLKYYKLLFTLPSGKIVYVVALMLLIATLWFDPLVGIALTLFSILFYEERALNGRRLSFLIVVSSLADLLGKPMLSALFMGVASALYSPNPLLVIAAPNVLYLAHPFAFVPTLPVALALWYGKRNGTAEFGIYWMRAWMGDDYHKLEKYLFERGTKKKAKKLRVGPLMFTDVHFGLMRYCMGSLFPHLVAVNGVVPHRLCGSHENNPASRWETYKLVSSPPSMSKRELKLVFARGKDVNAYIYDYGEGCVVVIEHPNGADDLPCVSWRCEVADPHNSEGPSPPEERLLEELSTIEKVKEAVLKDPKVIRIKVKGKWLCEDEGFLIDWGTFKHAIVFGNNAKRGKASLSGVDLVSTVDDHSCAGFGRKTYEPCELEGYEEVKAFRTTKGVGFSEQDYVAMGERVFSKEAQRKVIQSIKVGIASVIISLILSLI